MPKFPGAIQKPISGPSGAHLGGPFKIVHHTTEGSTAEGAFDAFRTNRSDPHFTIDDTNIYQHIDTAVAARALRNPPGGVQTNRDSAVQIEVVGFAHRPKSKATLRNVARLCRWIEATHGVPQTWPSGLPKPTKPDGKDPGGHNRNALTWDTKGGHYGHSQVPENIHYDPGYLLEEVTFIMEFDPSHEVLEDFDVRFAAMAETDPGLATDVSRMPDHAEVGEPSAAPVMRRQQAVWQPLLWSGLLLAAGIGVFAVAARRPAAARRMAALGSTALV